MSNDMTIVKIIAGYFKDYVGVIAGYHFEHAIVTIPFNDDRNESILLKSKDYEIVERC